MPVNSPHDYQLLHSSLSIAVVLFVVGAAGFAARRNVVVKFLSAALMLQGGALAWCALGSFHGDAAGRAAGLLVLVLTSAAALPAAAATMQLRTGGGTLDAAQLGEPEQGGEAQDGEDDRQSGSPSPREAAHE
jgi:NADH-quinone oxidoreductase subunit K